MRLRDGAPVGRFLLETGAGDVEETGNGELVEAGSSSPDHIVARKEAGER